MTLERSITAAELVNTLAKDQEVTFTQPLAYKEILRCTLDFVTCHWLADLYNAGFLGCVTASAVDPMKIDLILSERYTL